MIERYLRTFITKILFFIFIKPPLLVRFGRHSTTDISYRNYTRRNDYIFFQKIICPNCHKIMACKAPGGSKKKYIYYQCNKCKTYVREYKIVELLMDEITDIIEYIRLLKNTLLHF